MPEKIVCTFVYITTCTSISDIYISQCMVVDTYSLCSIQHSFLYVSIQCHSIALELQLIVLPIILSILFYHSLSNSNLKSDGDFSS